MDRSNINWIWGLFLVEKVFDHYFSFYVPWSLTILDYWLILKKITSWSCLYKCKQCRVQLYSFIVIVTNTRKLQGEHRQPTWNFCWTPETIGKPVSRCWGNSGKLKHFHDAINYPLYRTYCVQIGLCLRWCEVLHVVSPHSMLSSALLCSSSCFLCVCQDLVKVIDKLAISTVLLVLFRTYFQLDLNKTWRPRPPLPISPKCLRVNENDRNSLSMDS